MRPDGGFAPPCFPAVSRSNVYAGAELLSLLFLFIIYLSKVVRRQVCHNLLRNDKLFYFLIIKIKWTKKRRGQFAAEGWIRDGEIGEGTIAFCF